MNLKRPIEMIGIDLRFQCGIEKLYLFFFKLSKYTNKCETSSFASRIVREEFKLGHNVLHYNVWKLQTWIVEKNFISTVPYACTSRCTIHFFVSTTKYFRTKQCQSTQNLQHLTSIIYHFMLIFKFNVCIVNRLLINS